jgi:hypothetical protein
VDFFPHSNICFGDKTEKNDRDLGGLIRIQF